MEYKEMKIESLLKMGQKSELGRFGQAKSREGLNLSYHTASNVDYLCEVDGTQ